MNIQNSYAAVLTTYNSEATIRSALTSILAQELMPAEIFICDDFSTDRTVAIIEELQEEHPNIMLLRNSKNLGQSQRRNDAVSAASSDYLIFFDDDDKSLKNRANLHFQMFKDGSDLNYVSSVKVYENGYEKSAHNSHLASFRLNLDDLVKYLLLGKRFSDSEYFVPSCTLAMSRNAFLGIGGFDKNLRRLEDVDIAIRCAAAGMKFSFSEEIGVIRSSTLGDDKGKGIDSSYERILLDTHKSLIGSWAYLNANCWQTVRKLYFERKFVRLFLYTFFNPIIWLQLMKRIKNVLGRLKHDFSS